MTAPRSQGTNLVRYFPVLLCLAAQDPAAPSPPSALLAAIRASGDRCDPALLTQISGLGTREAAEALISACDLFETPWMKREAVRALAAFDPAPDAAPIALQKIADLASASSVPELREAAIDSLGACPGHGRSFLRALVESTLPDPLRERAMQRHVALATEEDHPYYRSLVDFDPKPEGQAKRRPRKGEPPERRPTPLRVIRELALSSLAPALSSAELLERARERADPSHPNLDAGLRGIALRELLRRGEKRALATAEEALGDRGETAANRSIAARILAALEGAKAADRFLEVGTQDESVTPLELRRTLADLVSGFDAPALKKRLLKLAEGSRSEGLVFALQALGDHGDPRLAEKLVSHLASGSASVRVAALQALTLRRETSAVEATLKLLESSEDPGVVLAALEALDVLRAGDPSWAEDLERLAQGSRAELRNAALGRLASIDAARYMGLLLRALQHEDWTTRLAALRALESTRSAAAVAPIVERMGLEKGLLLQRFQETLWSLTGERLGPGPEAWKDWLARQGEGFAVITPAELERRRAAEERRRLTQSTRVDIPGREPVREGTYFGIVLRSRRTIFILDVSGSMNELRQGPYVGEKGEPRLVAAKRELARSIDALEPDSLYNVLAFSDGVQTWVEGVEQSLSRSRDEAKEYVERLAAAGGTNIYGAIKTAFADPDVDTIFLLSDGEPSVGEEVDPLVIREHVKAWNATRGVAIHTIAIGEALPTLEWIALDSGGTYVRFE